MDEVHLLCQHGNGFTHTDIYEMPIRYRHYHLKKVIEFLEQQSKAMNGEQEVKQSPGKIDIPDFVTKAKAPKK